MLKHKIAFEDARLVFDDINVSDEIDTSMDYGEERSRAVGFANGIRITVFYILRGHRFRIISDRKASWTEEVACDEQNQ